MSQIETRRNLVNIDSISEIYSNAITLSKSILELFESAKVEFKNTPQASNLELDNSSIKFVKNTPIESPISIETKFQQIYIVNLLLLTHGIPIIQSTLI